MVSEVVVWSLLGVKLSCVSDRPVRDRRVIEWRLGFGRWYLSIGRTVEDLAVSEDTAVAQTVMLRILGCNGDHPFPAVVHDDVWVCVVREAVSGVPAIAIVVGKNESKAVVMLESKEQAVVLSNAIMAAMDGVYPSKYQPEDWQWN